MKPLPFYKNIASLLFLNLLVKPLWIFGVDRQVQNTVGNQVYGAYFSLLNLSLVFSFLADAGLSNMMNRQIASGLPYNAMQLLRLKLFLAVVYVLLVAVTAWLTGVQQWSVLLPVLAIQLLLSFFNFFRSLVTAHQLFGWDAWLSVIDKGLMLLLFLPLLYLFQNPISISFFLKAQLLCTTAAVCVVAFLLLNKRLLHTTATGQSTHGLLKKMAPYAAIILAMSAHTRLDGFLLERLHPDGATEAGVYAASYRLLDAANMVGYLVASFLVPFLARNQANRFLIQEVVLTARHALLLFGIFATLLFVFFAAPVQQALYPAATSYSVHVLQWCLPVLPAYLLLQVYGSVLTAMGQLTIFLRWLVIAVVLNILLNAFLIPKWGAVGCCAAALASQYVCAISVAIAATRSNGLKQGTPQLLQLVVVSFLLGVLFFVGKSYLHPLPLAFAGGGILLLALIAYLPHLKRSFILSR